MTVCLDGEVAIHVPEWVRDFDTFVTWMHSDDFPEEGRIDFLNNEVWIDISLEELFSHNFVKSALTLTLAALVRDQKLGVFVTDGMRFTNEDAGVATTPDGLFFTFDALTSGRITTRAGQGAVATELRGSPELVVEVVSPSSVDKDTEWFMSAYWNAGVTEYWVIDARRAEVGFAVFKRGPKGYTAGRRGGRLERLAFASFRPCPRTPRRSTPPYKKRFARLSYPLSRLSFGASPWPARSR